MTGRKESRDRWDQLVHQVHQASPDFRDKPENKAKWDDLGPRVNLGQLVRKETEEFQVRPEVVDCQDHRATLAPQGPQDLPVQLVQWAKQVLLDPQEYQENRDC